MAIASLFSVTASVETASATFAPTVTWGAATKIGDLLIVTVVRDDATGDSLPPTDSIADNIGNTSLYGTTNAGISAQSNAGAVAMKMWFVQMRQAVANAA